MTGATFAVSCEVPDADVRAFLDALVRYRRETSRDMKSAVRSATLDLLRSLRARTRKTKKYVERDDVQKSQEQPKWVKGKDGRPLRRMQIARWTAGKRRFVHAYVCGGEYVRGPNGGQRLRPFSEAHVRREARRTRGRIWNWGLAKKSWGWFMASLFGRGTHDENPRAKIRPYMVEREMAETDGDVSITIVNKLRYIRQALQPGAFAVSLRKAANSINKKISAGLKSRRFSS